MTRSTRFLWMTAFGQANFLLTAIIGLWLISYLRFRIGKDELGVWTQLTQLFGYLLLLDFGVMQLLPRDLGAATAAGADPARVPNLIATAAKLVFWQVPVVFLGACAATAFLHYQQPGLLGPICATFGGYVLLYPLRLPVVVLMGLQDVRCVGLLQGLNTLISSAIIVTLAISGFGLYSLAIGWFVGQLVTGLAAFLRIRRAFPGVWPATFPAITRRDLVRQMKSGGRQSLGQVGYVIGSGDVIYLGLLYPSAVLAYAITTKIPTTLTNVAIGLSTPLVPGITQLRHEASRERMTIVLIAQAQVIALVLGLIGVLTVAVNRGFVAWFTTPVDYLGDTATLLLAVGLAARHFASNLGLAALAAGLEDPLAKLRLIEGPLLIALALDGACFFGPVGFALGMVLASVLFMIPATLLILRPTGILPVRRLIAGLGWWAIRVVVLLAMAIVLPRYFSAPDTFLRLACACTGVTILYAAVMLPPALHREVGEYVRPRLAKLRGHFQREKKT